MSVQVRVPSPLLRFTKQQGTVTTEARSVAELFGALELLYPGIGAGILDEQGKVRRFVNVFVNDRDIRSLAQEVTELKSGDVVSIIPAIAGGI